MISRYDNKGKAIDIALEKERTQTQREEGEAQGLDRKTALTTEKLTQAEAEAQKYLQRARELRIDLQELQKEVQAKQHIVAAGRERQQQLEQERLLISKEQDKALTVLLRNSSVGRALFFTPTATPRG